MFYKFYSVALQRISVKKACLLLTAIYGFINAETFTLGYITGSKRKNGDLEYQRPGFRISGAMNLAIEEVNAGELAQLGHKLDFFVAETFGDEDTSILMTAELWKKNITAYIGPQETCIHEGRMAAAFNLPMISYVTFMYMNSSLFEFNNKMSSVANTILSSFDASGIAVNFKKCWNEPYHVTHMKNPFHELVEASFHETRIYVILGNYYEHMGLLMALDNRKLLDDGEYWVVGVDIEQYDEEQPDKYLRGLLQEHTDPSLLRAYRSYFSIVASASVNFENFTKIINEYREKPPFNFINPLAKLGGVVQIVPETAYLYDAVHLYAKSLLSALKEGWNPRDGRKMIEKLRGVHYHSAMGYMVYMDENGDAEGNYTLIALANNSEREPGLYPVGHFVGKEELSNLPKLRLTRNITWLTGVPPVAEPFCGYHGEKCYSRTGEIVGGVAGGILLILIAMVSVLYRNWRYEQELDSLLWKVNYKDIQIRGSKDEIITAETTLKSHSKPIVRTSQVSLSSNPEADFRYSTIYTRIGFYRGRMFAIKKVGKKSIEITREMKKELKMMRDLRHDNLNAFIGACTDPPNICIVVEYCSRGSLKDIIENDDMKLDNMFMASLVGDIIAGMIYLHESVMKYHGNLRTSNCLVDSRWVVKIADFGLREFKRDAEYEPDDIMQKFQSKEKKHHLIRIDDLYRSPELLRPRMSEPSIRDYQKADTYSFSIILYELHGRQGPYGPKSFTTLDIISLLRSPPTLSAPYRPPLEYLENCFDFVRDCLIECWAEDPDLRPDFKTIRNKLRPLRKGMKPNIFDNMMALMEKYANNLEALVDERTDQLTEEKKKTDALLYEMLPKYVAEQLKKGHKVEAEGFDCVTIYFSDIIGFTQMSAESTPLEVVNFLNDLYTCFDATIENYDVYKVETIGDAYMVVSGLPIRNGIQHAAEIASMSLCLLKKIKKFSIRHRPFDELQLRIGIHSGPVCAGVVGLKMPRYCLFGDTVNTASRMESTGSPLRIHCSKETKFLLDQIGGFWLEERGMVEMKGKGEHMTYWLLREEPGRKQGRHHVIDQTLVPKSSLRNKTRMSFLRCSSDTPKRLRFASSDQLDQGKEKIADSQDWSPCKGCMERSKSSSSSCPCVEKLEFGGNCFRRENALPEGYKSVAGSPRYVSKGMGRFGGITEVEATPLI